MTYAHRSGCSTNLSLEVFGDKWSVLILGGPKVTDLLLSCGELPEPVQALGIPARCRQRKSGHR